MRIEQAIYGSQDAGGYRFLARSPGFVESWRAEAQRICTGFGERPAGVRCPQALFVRPLGKQHVAVVQVADQGSDDAGRPGALAFRLLVLTRRFYHDLGGDPFLVSDRFRPDWGARGDLPALEWSAGPPPRRAVAEGRKILDVEADRTALLLGGAQALVDGGRLAFTRPGPDERLVRDLWALLPTSNRSEMWPATFAFGNAHGFHVAVVPEASGPDFERYLHEKEAGDYPEGRYEFALQKAAEDNDQAEIDTLFARRSRSQTLRLGLFLLVAFILAALIMRPAAPPPDDPSPKDRDPKGGETARAPVGLPPPGQFAALGRAEREELAGRLKGLADKVGVRVNDAGEESLRRAVAEIDRRLDENAGKDAPQRPLPEPLEKAGPVQRALRLLLWKHGGEEYAEPGLNAAELVERLERRLVSAGRVKE